MVLAFSERANFVGATTSLRQVCARMELASGGDVPFFFYGETGSGKETLAFLYSGEPFVKLRCDRLNEGRLDEILGDSSLRELFPTKTGTLYLTELDAISPERQAKLASQLRASWRRGRVLLGSTRAPESDVWTPELRDVLFAFPLNLPPLRERLEDLPDLAELFYREARARLGEWPRKLTPQELERLRAASYPRNLDDLRALMDYLAERGTLPDELPRESASSSEQVAIGRDNFPSLDEAAARHIAEALRMTGGVVEGRNGAAELLKINPYTLRSRMKKLNLDWTKFRKD